jgi:hypothetical protein
MRLRGVTLFDLIAILAVVVIAALVVLPQRRVRHILSNEDRVVEHLRDIEQRLAKHRAGGGRDADKDGVGEYAPLTDILGDAAAAARRVGESDVWEIDGYLYQVMTPGGSKSPVPAGSAGAVPDYAEAAYIIVAWPAEPGETGMRAYLQTPFGVLRHQIDGYPYGADAPAPDWALVRYEGARVVRGLPYAGNDWRSPAQDLRKR